MLIRCWARLGRRVALRAQMLARITVPPPEEKPSAGVFALGVQQRAAANKRWVKA